MGSAQNQEIVIRPARVSDAASIVDVHFRAVHETAAQDYEKEILDEWSVERGEERLLRMESQLIENPDKTVMIVATIADVVVGFGEICPSLNELRAVYVSPQFDRTGVGRRLLAELEVSARANGVSELWCDSSLTAEKFYARNGFVSSGRGQHELRSGRKMACVKMTKRLDSSI